MSRVFFSSCRAVRPACAGSVCQPLHTAPCASSSAGPQLRLAPVLNPLPLRSAWERAALPAARRTWMLQPPHAAHARVVQAANWRVPQWQAAHRVFAVTAAVRLPTHTLGPLRAFSSENETGGKSEEPQDLSKELGDKSVDGLVRRHRAELEHKYSGFEHGYISMAEKRMLDALEAEDREKDRFGDRVLDPYAFPLLLGVPALVVALMYAWKKYRDFAKVELSPEDEAWFIYTWKEVFPNRTTIDREAEDVLMDLRTKFGKYCSGGTMDTDTFVKFLRDHMGLGLGKDPQPWLRVFSVKSANRGKFEFIDLLKGYILLHEAEHRARPYRQQEAFANIHFAVLDSDGDGLADFYDICEWVRWAAQWDYLPLQVLNYADIRRAEMAVELDVDTEVVESAVSTPEPANPHALPSMDVDKSHIQGSALTDLAVENMARFVLDTYDLDRDGLVSLPDILAMVKDEGQFGARLRQKRLKKHMDRLERNTRHMVRQSEDVQRTARRVKRQNYAPFGSAEKEARRIAAKRRAKRAQQQAAAGGPGQ